MSNFVEVNCARKAWLKHGKYVEGAAQAALRALRIRNTSLSISLISNHQMKALNHQFRGKRVPTNILSFHVLQMFPRPDLGKKQKYLGEVYLAPQHIIERGESFEHLAVHGVLHLAGYTHTNSRDRIEMETLERRAISYLH